MKTITKISLVVLCIGFFTCVNHEAKRNNPFDPGGPGYLYYSLMTSGFSSSGSSYPYGGTGTGTSTGTGTGNSGKPDLQLVSFDPPTTMLHENTYNISATITNAGTVDASGFYVSVYIGGSSTNSNCHASAGTNRGLVQVSSLASGASSNLSIPLTVSAGTSTGINYVSICLDPDSRITETSETNNYGNSVGTFIKNVTVGEYRPDITLVSFSPPSLMTRGSSYNLSATIMNSGNQDNIGAFYVSVYIGGSSTNSNCHASAGTNRGLVQVSSLASGASSTLTIPLTVSAGTSTGINYVSICLDPDSRIPEYSNGGESNNYGTAVGTHIKQVTVN
jgi:subtilase family serine protease